MSRFHVSNGLAPLSRSGIDPDAEGTPMALPAQAGRDPNEAQLTAIVRYSLNALAESTAAGSFGPEVDGYHARIVE